MKNEYELQSLLRSVGFGYTFVDVMRDIRTQYQRIATHKPYLRYCRTPSKHKEKPQQQQLH